MFSSCKLRREFCLCACASRVPLLFIYLPQNEMGFALVSALSWPKFNSTARSHNVPHAGVRHSTKIPKCGTHLSPLGFIFLLACNIIHQVDLPESIKFISRAHLNFLGDKYFMTTRTQSLIPWRMKDLLNLICHSRCALRDVRIIGIFLKM